MSKFSIFDRVPMDRPQVSKFDLGHDVKMSFQMGFLTPSMAIECLPGDRFTINPLTFLRFAPLVSPVMHKVRVQTRFFFVPFRLLWPGPTGWEAFITNQADVEHPYCETSTVLQIPEGGLPDYLGLPAGVGFNQVLRYSPMYQAAYRLIFDEYYRDQNLQAPIFVPLVPGDNSADYPFTEGLQRQAWNMDYFTACLPFAQKGDDVLLPLSDEDDIPVEWAPSPGGNQTPLWKNPFNGNPTPEGPIESIDTASNDGEVQVQGASPGRTSYDPQGTLVVDPNQSAVTINRLRAAFALQKFLEKMARGGTRMIEMIKAHFDVNSSDARLQRPEYIGGIYQNMVISEVLSATQNADADLGTMAGHGISVGGGNTLTYRCEEHGVLMGIICVKPDTAYQQGLHRKFTRLSSYLDYPWPSFSHLGEQEVTNKEIYAGSSDPDAAFGYLPRHSECRTEPSRVAGAMRSTLSFWHMGRIFNTEPALNEDFIACNPTTRIFANEDGDHIYGHIVNNVSVIRKLPKYGIPGGL